MAWTPIVTSSRFLDPRSPPRPRSLKPVRSDPQSRLRRRSGTAPPRPPIWTSGAKEVMEELNAGHPLLTQDLCLALPPVGDGLVQAELLDVRGLLSPIGRRRRSNRTAPSVMPRIHALWDRDWPRCCKTSIVTICSLVSFAKAGASQRALDVQDQLECAWLACRWMSSTTVVLNACQDRNDSGSLTPSLTGLVTVPHDTPGYRADEDSNSEIPGCISILATITSRFSRVICCRPDRSQATASLCCRPLPDRRSLERLNDPRRHGCIGSRRSRIRAHRSDHLLTGLEVVLGPSQLRVFHEQ